MHDFGLLFFWVGFGLTMLYLILTVLRGEGKISKDEREFKLYIKVMVLGVFLIVSGIGFIVISDHSLKDDSADKEQIEAEG